MATSSIQPPVDASQPHRRRSAVVKSFHVAFMVMVAIGALAATGLVLWLLSMLAHNSYGIFFGA